MKVQSRRRSGVPDDNRLFSCRIGETRPISTGRLVADSLTRFASRAKSGEFAVWTDRSQWHFVERNGSWQQLFGPAHVSSLPVACVKKKFLFFYISLTFIF